MIEKNDKAGTQGEDLNPGEKAAPKPSEAPKPTVRLAHEIRQLPAAEGEAAKEEKIFRRPVTENGEIRIFGQAPIWLPSAEEQEAGFTPLLMKVEKGKPDQIDPGSGTEATRLLLEQFPGIYKAIKAKGETN